MPLSPADEKTLADIARRFGKHAAKTPSGPGAKKDGEAAVDVLGMLRIFNRLNRGEPMPEREMSQSTRRRWSSGRPVSERVLIRQAKAPHPAGSQRGVQSETTRRSRPAWWHIPIMATVVSLIILAVVIVATTAHGNHGLIKRPVCVTSRFPCHKPGPSTQFAQSASAVNANTGVPTSP